MSLAIPTFIDPVPQHLTMSMINKWTRDSIQPDQFYRTGFETIFFFQDTQFALECVLSSVVPAEKEIVIAGTGNLHSIVSAANKFDIPAIVYDDNLSELQLIESFLYSRDNVSHLLLVAGVDDINPEKYIQPLSDVLKHKGIDLVLFCTSAVESISDRTNDSVDYMVGGWEDIPDNSFVVARRNKLVQTEGNSRSLNNDLYASWQLMLRGRQSRITPMET